MARWAIINVGNPPIYRRRSLLAVFEILGLQESAALFGGIGLGVFISIHFLYSDISCFVNKFLKNKQIKLVAVFIYK